MSTSCKRTLPKQTVTFTRRKEWKRGKRRANAIQEKEAEDLNDTSHLVEMKRIAYNQWQYCTTDVERQREYQSLRQAVRKTVSQGREVRYNAVMEEIKEIFKHATNKEVSSGN